MKTFPSHILKLAQAGLLAAFTAHAALAAVEKQGFADFDVNKDGVVNLEEFSARGGLEKAFRAGDTNKDGLLNTDEFVKAFANNDRAKAGKYLGDAWITAKVKALLVQEAKLKSFDVSVETLQGTVILSGSVDSSELAARAAQIAARVEGVKHVRNDLHITAKS